MSAFDGYCQQALRASLIDAECTLYSPNALGVTAQGTLIPPPERHLLSEVV